MRSSSTCRAARWLATARQVRIVRSASGVTRQTQVPVELVDDDRVADLDAELLELARVEQAVAVIADAADERGLPAELREGDDGIGDGASADEFRLVLLIAVEERLLRGEIDEHHAAALEPKRCELRIGDFHEDVDDGVTEAAELEWFHDDVLVAAPRAHRGLGMIHRSVSGADSLRVERNLPDLHRCQCHRHHRHKPPPGQVKPKSAFKEVERKGWLGRVVRGGGGLGAVLGGGGGGAGEGGGGGGRGARGPGDPAPEAHAGRPDPVTPLVPFKVHSRTTRVVLLFFRGEGRPF